MLPMWSVLASGLRDPKRQGDKAANMQTQYDDKPAGNLRENFLMHKQYRIDSGGPGTQRDEDSRKPADKSRCAGQYAARGGARSVNVGQFVKLQSGGKTQIARH